MESQSIYVPETIMEHIFSFSDIDTRIKNHVKPRKLMLTINWKPPKLCWMNNSIRHYIKMNYSIEYIYLRKETCICDPSGAYFYNKHMKITKKYMVDDEIN
jgi:hypothetical protein